MDHQKMMGFEVPGDQKVPVSVRDWNAMKLAMWRSKVGWEIAAFQAVEILERCVHTDGCPGLTDETAPCLSDEYEEGSQVMIREGCRDRELRMSALVVLNAARQFSPINARKLNDTTYFAPSREYFSEVLSSLGAAQVENDFLRGLLREAGIPVPQPQPNPGDHPALPSQSPKELT